MDPLGIVPLCFNDFMHEAMNNYIVPLFFNDFMHEVMNNYIVPRIL